MNKLGNEFLDLYMNYVEDTESPRIFHLWSALTAVAGALGRRNYLDFGIGPIHPNLYTLLVGPPGTRKSTAINIAIKHLRNATGTRFAPTDTSGKYQGLIKAMEDFNDMENFEAELDAAVAAFDLQALGNMKTNINPHDQHVLFIAASEFASFIGINSFTMINFLGKMYDGEDYDYQLKNEQTVLKDPLLNMLGGATPVNIATCFPLESIGQGFMSRIILVFGNKKYKWVARPAQLDKKQGVEIERIMNELYYNFTGKFTETKEAREYSETLYRDGCKLSDPRFIHYVDRRYTHLLKVTMLLAACRLTQQIELKDFKLAHKILSVTEMGMPDALGEFGLSPIALAQQKLIEYVRSSQKALTANELWLVMQKDVKSPSDFQTILINLINTNKIIKVPSKDGNGFIWNDAGERKVAEELSHE